MHILITGAAGMIGRKLVARLVAAGALNGKPIGKLTLIDVSGVWWNSSGIASGNGAPNTAIDEVKTKRGR